MADEKRTYVITVTTAGTAVAGPASPAGDYLIQAYKGNTGDYIYFGNDGADETSNVLGYAVKKDGVPGLAYVNTLEDLRFDADTSGDKAIAIRI